MKSFEHPQPFLADTVVFLIDAFLIEATRFVTNPALFVLGSVTLTLLKRCSRRDETLWGVAELRLGRAEGQHVITVALEKEKRLSCWIEALELSPLSRLAAPTRPRRVRRALVPDPEQGP